jgi:F-type H+-transporting ATPase subunit delta
MSVAKSYARALFEAAADGKTSAAELDAIERQLEEVVRVVDTSKDARVALMSPATATREKVALITELAKRGQFSKLVSNFIVLLARKERLALIREIQEAFGAVRLEAEGGLLGRVVSADPMGAADLEGLSKAFTRKLGRRVAFRASTDPALLAGVKVTVSGVTYDGTLRTQLQRLRDRLVYGTGTTH